MGRMITLNFNSKADYHFSWRDLDVEPTRSLPSLDSEISNFWAEIRTISTIAILVSWTIQKTLISTSFSIFQAKSISLNWRMNFRFGASVRDKSNISNWWDIRCQWSKKKVFRMSVISFHQCQISHGVNWTLVPGGSL